MYLLLPWYEKSIVGHKKKILIDKRNKKNPL